MPDWRFDTPVGWDPENSTMERADGRIITRRTFGGRQRQQVNFGRAFDFFCFYNNLSAAEAAEREATAEADIGSVWDLYWHDGGVYIVTITVWPLFQPNVLGGDRWSGGVGFSTHNPGA